MYARALTLVGETKVSWYRAWFVALWVGSATGDAALLADEPDPSGIDRALETGKVQLFGPLVAIYASILAGRGDGAVARVLLRRALAAASAATLSLGTFPLIVVAAQLCDATDIDAVLGLASRDA